MHIILFRLKSITRVYIFFYDDMSNIYTKINISIK